MYQRPRTNLLRRSASAIDLPSFVILGARVALNGTELLLKRRYNTLEPFSLHAAGHLRFLTHAVPA